MVALQTVVNAEGPDNAHQTTMRALKAIANRNPCRAAMARIHRESTLIRKRRVTSVFEAGASIIRPST